MQIEKCKLGIREAVKECEISSGDRQILARHFDEDGEIDQKWIFCAKCCEAESYEVDHKLALATMSSAEATVLHFRLTAIAWCILQC